MAIKNALAGIAVRELDDAVAWYSRLIGRAPDSHPMPEVHEYRFPGGGWAQIFADADRAGKSSLTLTVDSIDDLIAALGGEGHRRWQAHPQRLCRYHHRDRSGRQSHRLRRGEICGQ